MSSTLASLLAEARAQLAPGHGSGLPEGVSIREGAGGAGPVPGPVPGPHRPLACIVLDGAMAVAAGRDVLVCRAGGCLLGALDLPVSGPETGEGCLWLSLALDLPMLSALIAELPGGATAVDEGESHSCAPAQEALLDACLRLLKCARHPAEAAVLGPMLMREIHFRLLTGPQGATLRRLMASEQRLAQVRRAVTWIQGHLDETVPVRDMAGCAGMSLASFNRHFRAATGLSPVQYQKRLRLQQARRLILAGSEVARAGYAVGYASASQFSREYQREFGNAPVRDLRRHDIRSDAPA
ncbi:AraC family transcriptional regulator [Oceanicella sp. SM1341]|uniref:AraC family transcriptional regulator n=1 Tax=Oceanicella sp. SM1341 TaxID=1548889 RepID=UPI000E4DB7B2|nr:AraC family transcriptional regulator [Oceanicella sp. SM1341]